MKHLTDRTCARCKTIFLGGPRAWYCPVCRVERAKETNAKYLERKRLGISRKIGDPQRCIDCGEVYLFYYGMSERCPECAKNHTKMLGNKMSREWNKNNAEKYKQAKKEYYEREKENLKKMPSESTGQRNITKNKHNKKYRVQICGKHIGYFDTLQEAINARDTFLQSKKE